MSSILDAAGNRESNLYICMIQLDHMRDKRNYVKTLERWNKDLGISGAIIFCGKGKIFLILIGSQNNLRDFQRRLKTSNVDVDSRGRPCKEKLSKVLCCDLLETIMGNQTHHNEILGNNDKHNLRLYELQDNNESLKKCFCDIKLEVLYVKYVHLK